MTWSVASSLSPPILRCSYPHSSLSPPILRCSLQVMRMPAGRQQLDSLDVQARGEGGRGYGSRQEAAAVLCVKHPPLFPAPARLSSLLRPPHRSP